MDNTEQNCEKLARQIVEDWDLDTLMDFAIGKLVYDYGNDKDTFDSDWSETFGE